ncbi:MAG: hypothetical protein HQ567_23900, partial [Candidatus Nealsonbacteria bacterium]|nr:hypothetical protein [Candidatus Nealsonbacteria bacterium]
MHRLMTHGLLLLSLVLAGILCGAVWAAEPSPLADPSLGEPAAADPQQEPGPDESGQSDDSAESAGESDADDSQVPPEKEPEAVGERLAAGMVELLQKEVFEGLKKRNIYTKFARFKSYAGGMLNATARSSGSELTGNCRLRW